MPRVEVRRAHSRRLEGTVDYFCTSKNSCSGANSQCSCAPPTTSPATTENRNGVAGRTHAVGTNRGGKQTDRMARRWDDMRSCHSSPTLFCVFFFTPFSPPFCVFFLSLSCFLLPPSFFVCASPLTLFVCASLLPCCVCFFLSLVVFFPPFCVGKKWHKMEKCQKIRKSKNQKFRNRNSKKKKNSKNDKNHKQ